MAKGYYTGNGEYPNAEFFRLRLLLYQSGIYGLADENFNNLHCYFLVDILFRGKDTDKKQTLLVGVGAFSSGSIRRDILQGGLLRETNLNGHHHCTCVIFYVVGLRNFRENRFQGY